MRRVFLWLPVIVYMAVIFYLSAESDPLPQVTAVVWDKLLHFVEYAGLGFLLYRAFSGEGLGWRAALAIAIVITSLYGASDEWHQSFVPLRDSDIHDWYTDTLGGTLGAFGCFAVIRLSVLGGWLSNNPRQVKAERRQPNADNRQ